MPAVLRKCAPAALLAFFVVLAACTDLEHFSTSQDESYCGSIAGEKSFRTGLSGTLRMRLVLDASLLDGPGSPGTLWTFDAADDGGEPLLSGAPLRRIASMDNDALSRPEFGEGRLQNRIYAVAPKRAGEEPLFAVLSLVNDGRVEVRLMRPGRATSPESPAPPGEGPLFGAFSLTKKAGTCGF